MNGAQLFVKCLEREGVEYIFGVPGEENEDLLFAIYESSIQFIPTRHEQGAAFMANLWGRLTGRAGVCLSTLGPGATNLVTGVADAFLDKAPIVAITGQGSIKRLHHESHQMIDVIGMFAPITKWNSTISHTSIIPEVVRKAFKIAQHEKPGAAHIELPEDLAGQSIENEQIVPLQSGRMHRATAARSVLSEVIERIKRATRPMIIAGNGAIRSRASKALTELSTETNLPVVSTFMGKGAISDKLSPSLGTVGLGFKDYISDAFEKADLILSVGYDIAEYDPKGWNIGIPKSIIHLDFEPAEVFEHYSPDFELIGDLANTLEEIQLGLKDVQFTSWYDATRARIKLSIERFEDYKQWGFSVPTVLGSVRSLFPDDGILISDVGTHKMWIARNFPTYCSNGCIISNGLASMGIALPGGIGAKLAYPDRKVIALMGDGGALMNIQELETAHRLKLHIIYIILNDNNYGLITWKQEMSRNKSVGTEISNPDFVKLGESFGAVSYKPASEEDFRLKLEMALDGEGIHLFEIPINTTVNKALTAELEQYFSKK